MGRIQEGKRCCHRIGSCIGLQCCTTIDADNPVPYAVPNSERFCTDTIWCIAFLLMLISQTFLISYAKSEGADTRWLFHGIDINAVVCDENHEDSLSLAMWPAPLYYHIVLCTDKCSKTNKDDRFPIPYESQEILNAWCVPTDADMRKLFDKTWDSAAESMNRALGDIMIGKEIIIASAVLALVFCFMYMGYVGLCGGVIIWVTIILAIIGGGFLSYALIVKSEDVIAMGWEFTGNLMLYTGWTLAVITGLFALGILFMRSRIALAIRVIKEASKAMGSFPSIVFFPTLCCIIAALYFGFWVITAFYIYSVPVYKEYILPPEMRSYLGQRRYTVDEFDEGMRDVLLYHTFGLFWTIQFIIYFCYIVMAHVFAQWYFCKEDENGKKVHGNDPNEMPSHPIIQSIWRICRYHLGTVAFGAFIVAAIKFTKAVLTYLQSKSAGKSNPVAVAIFSCIKCILRCLECCIDTISKHGFVFTSLYGTCFCHSCTTAFRILFSNLARVAAVSLVSSYLEFLGKIAITLLTTGVAIIVMEQTEYYAVNLSSLFLPVVIILLLSYGIATIFMTVFEVAIDTIFLCFLIDEQCHIQGAHYATDEFKQLIDEHHHESIKKAHHIKSSTMAHKSDAVELTEMHRRGTEYTKEKSEQQKQKKHGRNNKRNHGRVEYVSEAKSEYHGHGGDDTL